MTITTFPSATTATPRPAPFGRWTIRVSGLALATMLAIGIAVLVGGDNQAPAAQDTLRDGWQANIATNTNPAQATLHDGWQANIPAYTTPAQVTLHDGWQANIATNATTARQLHNGWMVGAY